MSKNATIIRVLCLAGAVASGLASAFLWLLFYSLYWQHRGAFNSEGRYFDATGAVVYHEQSWIVALPAALCLSLAVAFVVWFARRSLRQQSRRPNDSSKPTPLRGAA